MSWRSIRLAACEWCGDVLFAQTGPPQAGIEPLRVLSRKGWFGIAGPIEAGVTPVFEALVHERLEIQDDVSVAFTQRYANAG